MELLDEKVYCRACDKITNHFIIFQTTEQVRSGKFIFDIYVSYTVIRCAGCDTVSYANILISNEFDNQGNQVPKREIAIFPEEPKVTVRINEKMDIKYSSTAPKNITEIYSQIVDSYNRGHNLLCAVGLRTLIEAICNELNITKGYKYDSNGKPLTQEGKKESKEGQINGLFEKHYITWYHALILQRIREIGNAATHELIQPTSDELYGAIGIVERLIEEIYELKNHNLLKN